MGIVRPTVLIVDDQQAYRSRRTAARAAMLGRQ
jgi:hypothetical protein